MYPYTPKNGTWIILVSYATTLEDIYIFTFTFLFLRVNLKVTYVNRAGKYKIEIGKG